MRDTTESIRVPRQEPPPEDVVEYGPDVPLAVRLKRERAQLING